MQKQLTERKERITNEIKDPNSIAPFNKPLILYSALVNNHRQEVDKELKKDILKQESEYREQLFKKETLIRKRVQGFK